MRIRTYLFVFALAILLPAIAFAVVAVVAFDRQQRARVERGGVETARALMSAVDRELAGAIAALAALATARSLEGGDLGTFHDDARRTLASQQHWRAILLTTPSGEPKVHTSLPFGGSPPPIVDRESFETVLRTRRPTVGGIAVGTGGRYAFAVRVPALRDGRLAYVLSAVVEPAAIATILSAQHLRPDWVGAVFDARRNIVARSQGTEQYVGRPISPEFARALPGAREGWTSTHTLEGRAVYTAFSRSTATDWGVGLGIPREAIDAPLRRSLWTIAGGGLALLGIAVMTSILVGRRIARPIVALATSATRFGESEEPDPLAPGGPAEVSAVSQAFVEGSRLLRARATERDAALTEARAAHAQAEAASVAKDEFLAVLSHELRTPLNAVYGWVRMLRRDEMDPTTRARALEAIERNASAQVRLIDDLLDVSRIITGKMRLDLHPVDVREVVKAAVESVRPAAQAKHIVLGSARDGSPLLVTGDRERLQQVVWNLVSNSVKFTPSGGRVEVEVRRSDGRVDIVVSDTGIGIESAVLPYVFDRFRQADSSTTRAHGGLGLGLALVRQVVELHGGTVTAESGGRGQGATFVVSLPVALSEAPSAARS
jgi:signal transduction histidine kinase